MIKSFFFFFLNHCGKNCICVYYYFMYMYFFIWWQVKKVIVYLGRDKTMQLLEELVSELQLTDPVSSGVTHMDNPPYYRITSSYKIPSVTSGENLLNLIYYCWITRWLHCSWKCLKCIKSSMEHLRLSVHCKKVGRRRWKFFHNYDQVSVMVDSFS